MKRKGITMNWKLESLGAAVICLVVSGSAFADTLVIKYASGEVQTVALSGPAKDIQDIKVGETSVPLSEKVKQFLLGKQPAPDQAAGKEPQAGAKKSGPLLQWAPPLAE
ncbi:hypothetical protein KOM00_06660 [Geomonas sp. Red69]|uniref:hypothetical protein n=1 Tax=Geomonas diazotrophica TaxID=2843197 RepID=UPI001C0FC6A4|nr:MULTISPECIES: hypothetical protein [Geomonas]MBU5636413.1 hypothetical protein [Geomonas diazotrophica]QXE88261.1 hypothetical protein KP003_07630 [Geomonas nitrogeniifigens]